MYMMEHPGFGYMVVDFVIELHGQQACMGSVINEAGRRTLGESQLE